MPSLVMTPHILPSHTMSRTSVVAPVTCPPTVCPPTPTTHTHLQARGLQRRQRARVSTRS